MKNYSHITHRQIIDALGGSAKIAKKLGIPDSTVRAWYARGIPAKVQLENPEMMRRGRRLANKVLSSP